MNDNNHYGLAPAQGRLNQNSRSQFFQNQSQGAPAAVNQQNQQLQNPMIINELNQQQNLNKAHLWQMIEKISEQFQSIAQQNRNKPQDPKFQVQHEKLNRLIALRKKCLLAEKAMREKQLALMRERNLYLEKCRQIEEYGESVEWGGEDSYDNEGSQEITEEQKLLQEVYDILYTEK